MTRSAIRIAALAALTLAACKSDSAVEPDPFGVAGVWLMTVGPIHDESGFSCTYHFTATLQAPAVADSSVTGTLIDTGSACDANGAAFQTGLPNPMIITAKIQDNALLGFFGIWRSRNSFLVTINGDAMTGGTTWGHTAPDTTVLTLSGPVFGTRR